jgi:uncharacterized protein
MEPFSLLLKPASADCNLRCDYCFYLEKSSLYPGSGKRRMTDQTLRTVLERYFETTQPVYSMIWQGGEPTLMGEPFYKRVVDLQKKLAPRGAHIANALQTNATLIKNDLAAHLAKYRFLVGCSIDGPADLHDAHRRTRTRRNSHARAVQGVRTLQAAGVPVNAVVLVSATNVSAPLKVYRHLLELGIRHIQFVPCVESDSSGRPLPFSIDGKTWGEFLLAVFEQWHAAHRGLVFIRNFDSVMAKMAGLADTECRLCNRCDQYLVVEHNGDVYPCDFYVGTEMKLGNVSYDSFEAMRERPLYSSFSTAKQSIPTGCTTCEHASLCMGDCPKFRSGKQRQGVSILCSGWQHFFQEARGRLESLVRDAVR